MTQPGHDIEHWLLGLRGGPLRVADQERKHPVPLVKRRREWPVWLCLAAVTVGFLTAVVIYR
jgi:hypothetical protein